MWAEPGRRRGRPTARVALLVPAAGARSADDPWLRQVERDTQLCAQGTGALGMQGRPLIPWFLGTTTNASAWVMLPLASSAS